MAMRDKKADLEALIQAMPVDQLPKPKTTAQQEYADKKQEKQEELIAIAAMQKADAYSMSLQHQRTLISKQTQQEKQEELKALMQSLSKQNT